VEDIRSLSDTELRAWQGFVALQTQVMPRIFRELQRTTGLSGPDYLVLSTLNAAPHGRLRAFEILNASGWERSRLSHHLTRMDKRGLVERHTLEEDPRYAEVVLTAQGRAAYQLAAPIHLRHVRRHFFDALEPENVTALSALADRVLAVTADDA
jgi:DNA-binding MarR family transcriptional regulator